MAEMIVVAENEAADRLLDYLIVYKNLISTTSFESLAKENLTLPALPEPELAIEKESELEIKFRLPE